MVFELELDNLSEGIRRQIERYADGVGVDAQNRLVVATEYRCIIFVPYLACKAIDSFSKFGGCGFGVGIEPFPHRDFEHRHSANLIHAPCSIEHVERLLFFAVAAITQNLEVLLLEDKSQGFGECSVWHAVHGEVVDVVERDGLFHVVPEFVYGDVITLVVHTAGRDAGAQVRQLLAVLGTPGMTAAASRVHGNAVADIFRSCFAEPEFFENFGQVGFEGFIVGIFAACDSAQLLFVDFAAGLEAVIPDVEGFESAPQPLGDFAPYQLHLGSRQIPAEDAIGTVNRYLHVVVEVAVDIGVAAIFVHQLFGVEDVEQILVAAVALRLSLHHLARL